jgi:tetratricopeptide (TPR) repeat protein
VVLLETGKNDEAITYFDKVLALDPRDVDSLNSKGVALANLKNYYEANKYFDKALEIDPGYGPAQRSKQQVLGFLK